MKTAKDPRHRKRIKVMQLLFSWQFKPEKKVAKEITDILTHIKKIDQLVASSAKNRPIDQINKIDLAILRLAVFELIINKEPPKVVIDEAIELGKEYGSDSSSSFINGTLGQVVKLKKIKL